MNTLICRRCGQSVESKPCPYCGSANVIIAADMTDGVTLGTHHSGLVITAPSKARVESEGLVREFSFNANTTSVAIIAATLHDIKITLPPRTRQLLIENINQTELMAQQAPIDETAAYSFKLNLGIFKFDFQRMGRNSV